MSKKIHKFIHIYYKKYYSLPNWKATIESFIYSETSYSGRLQISPFVKDQENKFTIEFPKELVLDSDILEGKVINVLRELEFESVLDKRKNVIAEEYATRLENWGREETKRRNDWETSFSKVYKDGLDDFRRSTDKRREWESAEMIRRIEFERSIVKESQDRESWEQNQKWKINLITILVFLSSAVSIGMHFV